MAVTTRKPVEAQPEASAASVLVLVGGLAAIAVLLPLLSWALGLEQRIIHWGKLVHGVEGFLFSLIFALLLLGWRDRERVDVPDQLAALVAMFAGVMFGVFWKIVEFVYDWSFYADLEKSNSDTMTDFLWNHLGAIVGAVLAARLYCHVLNARQRQELGGIAAWLVAGPARVLDKHGVLVTAVVCVLSAAAVAAVWFASRPLPGVGVS